jgi:hypothetical protein
MIPTYPTRKRNNVAFGAAYIKAPVLQEAFGEYAAGDTRCVVGIASDASTPVDPSQRTPLNN